MGMYSVDTSSLDSFDVPVMEGFEGTETELQDVMVEAYQDQLAMFETGLIGDMKAAMGKIKGLDEEAIESIQEGVLGDVWNRIKEFVKKIWTKIKSIFHAFIARFEAVFGKDDKAFVDKYKKEIFDKNLADFEVKYRKPKGISEVKVLNPNKINDFLGIVNKAEDALEKEIENFEHDDVLCEYLNGTLDGLKVTSPKEYEKEAMDAWFEDEEEQKPDMHEVMTKLINSKEALKKVKKAETDADKNFSKAAKAMEKYAAEITKARAYKKEDENKESGISNNSRLNDDNTMGHTGSFKVQNKDLKKYQLAARLAQMHLSALSAASSKSTAFAIKATKLERSTNRRIWAKAVAYRKKGESTYMDAVAESVLYEWDMMDQEALITESKKAKKGKGKGKDKKLGDEADLGSGAQECKD